MKKQVKRGRKTNQEKHDAKMNKIMLYIYIILAVASGLFYINRTAFAPKQYKEEIIEEIKHSEEVVKEVIKERIKPVVVVLNVDEYRLTSYYTNDSTGSGKCTGSGLCIKDFKVNENGWYTYNGKLVMAGATNECLNSHSGACNKWNYKIIGRHYFDYYDELVVVIDGVEYDSIILDSCGASMYVAEDRIDLFVSGSNHFIDRGYKGVNPIEVIREVK